MKIPSCFVLSLLLIVIASTAAERPNIILCMADDQGWEETGYNGHPFLLTPVLDEMARVACALTASIPRHQIVGRHGGAS